MKLFFTLLICLGVHAQEFQMADVGFPDTDAFIRYKITEHQGEEAYKFILGNSQNDEGIPIGSCVYTRSSLRAEGESIEIAQMKLEFFDWFFRGSDRSKVSSQVYYAEFKKLLE